MTILSDTNDLLSALSEVYDKRGDLYFVYDQVEGLMSNLHLSKEWDEYFLNKEANIVDRKIVVSPRYVRAFINNSRRIRNATRKQNTNKKSKYNTVPDVSGAGSQAKSSVI